MVLGLGVAELSLFFVCEFNCFRGGRDQFLCVCPGFRSNNGTTFTKENILFIRVFLLLSDTMSSKKYMFVLSGLRLSEVHDNVLFELV